MKLLRLIWIILAVSGTAAAGTLNWGIITSTGFQSNPTGTSDADAQGLGWTQFNIRWIEPESWGSLSIKYAGSAYAYVPRTQWAAHRHIGQVGLLKAVTPAVTAGSILRFSASRNHTDYTSYDYNETTGRIWLRGRLTPFRYNLNARYDIRRFSNSPEFNYDQTSFSGSISRSWQTRTSAKLTATFRAREYAELTIDDIANGREQGTSRQFMLSGRVSQNVDSATGLKLTGWYARGTGTSRWQDDYWLYMDDPLARSGYGGRIQVSHLIPAGITARLYTGGSWNEDSYVDSEGYDAIRRDKVGEAGIIIEGMLPWAAASRAFSWSLEGTGTIQRSSDPYYDCNELSIMAGIEYNW